MSIATEREAIAASANTVSGLSVRPSGPLKAPKPGDGWVVVGRLTPGGFRTVNVVFIVVVTLGAELTRADELLDLWAVPLMDAVTSVIACADVVIEPVALSVESGGTVHGLTLTITTEI